MRVSSDASGHRNPHIRSVSVLEGKPEKEYALRILKDIARQVSYLMKEYKLKVGTLVEFYPKNKRLLGMNVNHGAKVMLRLRDPSDEKQFLHRESILGTMLHELTHNDFGPHNKKFYERLDELTGRQWYFEQQKLFDTFLGAGKKLGAASSSLVASRSNDNGNGVSASQHMRNQRLRKFGQASRLDGGTASRSEEYRNKTPREMAAIAAERRIKDNRWCGEEQHDDSVVPSEDKLLEVIIISDDDEDSQTSECFPPSSNEPVVIDIT